MAREIKVGRGAEIATMPQPKGGEIVRFPHVAPIANLPICQEAADKLTLQGVGNFRLIKVEDQVNPATGQPLGEGQVNVVYIGQRNRKPLAEVVATAIDVKHAAELHGRTGEETAGIVRRIIDAEVEKRAKPKAA